MKCLLVISGKSLFVRTIVHSTSINRKIRLSICAQTQNDNGFGLGGFFLRVITPDCNSVIVSYCIFKNV